MTRPVSYALLLTLGCICHRLLFSLWPELLPNVSPVLAVALVATMYLPRRWGWLLGPAAMLASDVALLPVNRLTSGHLLSGWTVASLIFLALTGALGLGLARHRTLVRIAAASIACSVGFYLLANTFAWWEGSLGAAPVYSPTWAGWWQANTLGLPGWQPAWTFLRNGVLSDLGFAFLLVAAFEPQMLAHPLRLPVRASSAI